MMNKYRRPVLTLAGITLLSLAAVLLFGSGTVRTEESTGLPQVRLTLTEGSLAELNDGDKGIPFEKSQITIQDSGSGVLYADSETVIRGRGNSSWSKPKKSYQLRLGSQVSFFGMEPSKKWLLLSNYADASLMRNKLILDLAGDLMPYVPQTQYVDLWIDGTSLGNFLLTEKIEVGEGRVELKNQDGLLIEIDNIYYYESEESFTSRISGTHFTLKDSKADDLFRDDSDARAAFEEFEAFINRFEEALYAEDKDWELLTEMADVDSLVKFYYLEELAANSDSCRTSFYLYRDGAEDKLHFGPVWDFDKAVGYSQTTKYGGNTGVDYVSQIEEYMGSGKDLTWFTELFKIPEFREEAGRIYREEIQGVFETAGERIDALEEEIKSSAEQNYQIWDITEIPENCNHTPYEYTAWEDSVQDLKDWVEARTAYLTARAEE